MPPLITVVAPTVPVPDSMPPLLTVIVELTIEPLTARLPALTDHGFAAASVLVNVQVLVPTFWKALKP
ncbi:MAG: hypothetical protein WA820_18520 [Bradyrhizobium sp.]